MRIQGLPGSALDAAAFFHAARLPQIGQALAGGCEALAILFPPASYDHRGWRLAAVRDLARAYAPQRINAVSGDDPAAIAQTLTWLAGAKGITGQLLAVAGKADANRAHSRS